MAKSTTYADGSSSCTTIVNVDVTKIVKCSCISSVLIVLIVFGSNTIKHIFSK